MFNLRKRVENLENQLKINPIAITESDLYKFYLERKIDEINAKLKNKLTFTLEHKDGRNEDGFIIHHYSSWERNILIMIDNIEIKRMSYSFWSYPSDKDNYVRILNYLNSKSINYFIKIDKKIEELKKKNAELEKQHINIENELKKIL